MKTEEERAVMRKIVVDSSADLTALPQACFSTVPLTIHSEGDAYRDDESLDVADMIVHLKARKGRVTTSCPAPAEWLSAFGDADEVFCVTITSALSGSNNAAQVAAADYQAAHPDRRVVVVDTLSAGPEVALIAERLAQGAALSFDTLAEDVARYLRSTRLVFALQSIRNLANNGRVSPAVAALVGLLGIRIIGRASDTGELQLTGKCRGDKRALAELVAQIEAEGWRGGRVRIHHCCNEEGAQALRKLLIERRPDAEIVVAPTRGLCSFYAEDGGLLIGFEV